MPKYKATAYIRLSYTDDRSSESDSVANQRKLIENFVERNPDIEVISNASLFHISNAKTTDIAVAGHLSKYQNDSTVCLVVFGFQIHLLRIPPLYRGLFNMICFQTLLLPTKHTVFP